MDQLLIINTGTGFGAFKADTMHGHDPRHDPPRSGGSSLTPDVCNSASKPALRPAFPATVWTAEGFVSMAASAVQVFSGTQMAYNSGMDMTPIQMHLKKDEALEITWSDQRQSRYPVRLLRRMCPCAGCKGERDLLGRTLLPILKTAYDGPITATGGELVGNYAMRIHWSDGHDSGIYSFSYLRHLADERKL